MKTFLGILLAAILSISAMPAKAAEPLAPLIGKKRVLLLFSKSRSDAQLDRQMALFNDQRSGFDARKTVVFTVLGGREPMAFIGYASLPFGAGRDLHAQFSPAPQGITVILVGLDGTEKGRWQHPVDPQAVFDLIDSMPMQQEQATEPTI
nr:DUF4174 domain-containing protein [Nitratireductor sp.]